MRIIWDDIDTADPQWAVVDHDTYEPAKLPRTSLVPVNAVALELARHLEAKGLDPRAGVYIGEVGPIGLRWEASC